MLSFHLGFPFDNHKSWFLDTDNLRMRYFYSVILIFNNNFRAKREIIQLELYQILRIKCFPLSKWGLHFISYEEVHQDQYHINWKKRKLANFRYYLTIKILRYDKISYLFIWIFRLYALSCNSLILISKWYNHICYEF